MSLGEAPSYLFVGSYHSRAQVQAGRRRPIACWNDELRLSIKKSHSGANDSTYSESLGSQPKSAMRRSGWRSPLSSSCVLLQCHWILRPWKTLLQQRLSKWTALCESSIGTRACQRRRVRDTRAQGTSIFQRTTKMCVVEIVLSALG